MILRCTGRLLAALQVRSPAPAGEGSGWYANLVWIERRKCLLLTHADTLFSVFVPDVRVSELRPPGPLVVAGIEAALRAEGLPGTALGELDPQAVIVAQTADRRVLGTMNDHVTAIEWRLAADGGLRGCDLDALHHGLHRTINSLTGYVPPIELVRGTG